MAFAPLDQQDHSDGNLTLHLAARAGHLEVVRSLVEAMASVHAQNKSGNSPLHLASAYARVEVMHFLLQARAHVNRPNFRGETPFNLALQDGLNEVAQILRCLVTVFVFSLAFDNCLVSPRPFVLAVTRQNSKVKQAAPVQSTRTVILPICGQRTSKFSLGQQCRCQFPCQPCPCQ